MSTPTTDLTKLVSFMALCSRGRCPIGWFFGRNSPLAANWRFFITLLGGGRHPLCVVLWTVQPRAARAGTPRSEFRAGLWKRAQAHITVSVPVSQQTKPGSSSLCHSVGRPPAQGTPEVVAERVCSPRTRWNREDGVSPPSPSPSHFARAPTAHLSGPMPRAPARPSAESRREDRAAPGLPTTRCRCWRC